MGDSYSPSTPKPSKTPKSDPTQTIMTVWVMCPSCFRNSHVQCVSNKNNQKYWCGHCNNPVLLDVMVKALTRQDR